MRTKGEVRPGGISAFSAKVGIVLATLFLIFGVVFFGTVFPELSDAEPALKILIPSFFLIFSGGCVTIILIYRRMLKTAEQASDNSLLEFRFESDSNPETGTVDFAERLRKLDSLKKDGLITEAEYRSKRKEILRRKW